MCSDPILKSRINLAVLICLQRKRGYTQLTGVDYSDLAILLAKSVSKSEGYEDINYQVCYNLSWVLPFRKKHSLELVAPQ